MLQELRVKNYAVIEELGLRLEPGLNTLTGETGAGKSIIVGALSLLLGERASSDVIRAGEDRAVIEAVFDVSARQDLKRRAGEAGIETEDGWLVLRREVNAEGRNRAWINGSPATATQTGEFGGALVDIHGQHEHQKLLHAGPQRAILDAWGRATDLAEQVAELWSELKEVRRQRSELESRRRATEERADFLRHQAEEIEAAEIEGSDEDERLEVEEGRLAHAEELLERASRLHQATYESDDSVLDRLGTVRRELESLGKLDPDAAEEFSELGDTAHYAVKELGERLAAYAESVELNPARLETVRRRMDLLYRLKSKYGPSLEDVVAAGERARSELDALDAADFELEELASRERSLREEVEARAGELTAARREAARGLEERVTELLPELGMPDGRFRVHLEEQPSIGARGAEAVEFRVSVNKGFEPAKLAKVASGGELSRVMLALKTILAELDATPTLVFDEIDAGIGGIVGQKVAERLKVVAAHHQVFVITHLPQIAALADHHLLVTKDAGGREKTATRVTELRGEERIRDVARMLGGDPDREAALEHARALLGVGEERSATAES